MYFKVFSYARLFFTTTLFIIALNINSAPRATEFFTETTSVDERNKVFETYYLANPDNKDPSVFAHMRKWHDEDFKALEATISQPAHKERLQMIHSILQQSFASQTVSFTKIALTYLLYSFVSSNDHSREQIEDLTEIIELTRDYFKRGDKPDYVPDQAKFSASHRSGYALDQVISIHKYGLHWLPYVSSDGKSSFRTLNNLFGMKSPTLGVPLQKVSAYDGGLDRTQENFAVHEVNHGGFFDNQAYHFIPSIFAHYHGANALIRRISDDHTRLICDYFLYELGHESSFGIRLDFSDITNTDPSNHRHTTFPTLNEVCDYTLKGLQTSTLALSTLSLPLDYHWPLTSNYLQKVGNTYVRMTQTKDEYYTKTSHLRHFVRPGTNLLFNIAELIRAKQLNKTKPFHLQEFSDALFPNALESIETGSSAEQELTDYLYQQIGLTNYNIRLELQEYLKSCGISMALWKGDDFHASELCTFFDSACQTFKREVGVHMKALVWEVKPIK